MDKTGKWHDGRGNRIKKVRRFVICRRKTEEREGILPRENSCVSNELRGEKGAPSEMGFPSKRSEVLQQIEKKKNKQG